MKRWGIPLVLFFAFCGLSNSWYIAQNETNGVPLICNVQNFSGCNVVAVSQYAHLFGVSLAWYGVFFYAFVFALAALELFIRNRFTLRTLQGASLAGVIASAYFTFLEIFVLHTLCIYCIASAVIALLIFIFANVVQPMKK